MKKFTKYCLLVLTIAVMVFTLTACNEGENKVAVPGGNPNAKVESNGGQLVKQGDKLFFVNGKSDENTPNGKDDSVVKGGIYRATINEDGSLKDFVSIVDKNVFSKGADGGFYIYGSYIYYLTPNFEKDKYGTLLNDRLDVMKVSINGTGSERLGTLMGLDFQYKFTNGSLLTFKDGKITIYKLEKDLPQVSNIKDVTAIIMPKGENFEKGVEYASDFVFYTRNLTEKEIDADKSLKNNVLGVVNAKNGKKAEVTFTNSAIDAKHLQIAVKNYLITADNSITLYYSVKDATGKSTKESLFAYDFTVDSLKGNDGKITIDMQSSQNHLIYDVAPISDFIPFENDGVLQVAEASIIYYNNNQKVYVTPLDADTNKGIFNGTFVALRKEANKNIMYYTTSTGLFKFEINPGATTNAYGAPTKIYDGVIGTNVFGNEFIDEYFYFDNGVKYDYVYRVNVNKTYTKDELTEEQIASGKLNPELVGVMTDGDKKAMEEADKTNN